MCVYVGGETWDVGCWKWPEAGSRRLEARGWKWVAGSGRLKVGGWKQEVGSGRFDVEVR